MNQELLIVRGLPGSGKSTFARWLVNGRQGRKCHVEADMWFTNKRGEYRFNPKELCNAHQWCRLETERLLRNGWSVVVANTFTTHGEVQPYLELADQYGVQSRILVCTQQYGNIHGVPEYVVSRMRSRWEPVQGEVETQW